VRSRPLRSHQSANQLAKSSHLQGDRAVAFFEARKDGRLYARQARDALPAEPQLAAPFLQDAAKLGR
jgi:hypothetical protein